MIQKLAVLIVEKADGSVETTTGEKGDISAMARDLIRETNDTPGHDIARITALNKTGVIKERKWKANWPAAPVSVPAQASEPVEVDDQQDADGEATDDPADVAELRRLLKDKGVKVPPRISPDKLLQLAVEHGVEP